MKIVDLRNLRQAGYLTKNDLLNHVKNFVSVLPKLTFGELSAYRSEIRKSAETLECMAEVDALAQELYKQRAE